MLEVEPLNGLVDHHGHFLQAFSESVDVIDQVGSPNVKLVFDVCPPADLRRVMLSEMQPAISTVLITTTLRQPGRKRPGTGGLNYVDILKAIKASGFSGFVGLECGYTVDTDIAIEQFKQDILSQLA